MTNQKPLQKKDDIFSEIFRNDFVRLCHYANNFIFDMEICKDIVQDVYVRIWETDLNIYDEITLQKILFKSVKNKCLDFLKRQKVRNEYRYEILQRLVEYPSDDFKHYEVKELSLKIESVLKQLPEQTYRIFDKSRVGGKTYSDIADAMGISVKTVEFHISKALSALRTGLKDYLPAVLYLLFFNRH